MSAFFTWNAIAAPTPAKALLKEELSFKKVHLIENLKSETTAQALKILSDKGYIVSTKPLFTESRNTLVITQTLPNDKEAAKIEVELMKMSQGNKIPHTIFKYELKTEKAEEALSALPRPEEILEADTITPEELKAKPMFTQQLQ